MYVNKNIDDGYVKSYYAPIIPTLVTAHARCLMYDNYNNIPMENLLYTDTDSVIMENDLRFKFKMGQDIGEFKTVRDNENGDRLVGSPAIIWGSKSKAIGNNMALSGVFKSDLTLEQFKEGKVFTKRMQGIKKIKDTGKFIIEERDLKKQEAEYWAIEKKLEEEEVFIDDDIKDIGYFIPKLHEIYVPD